GISFDNPSLKDSYFKISGITSTPDRAPGANPTLWTNCILVTIGGRLTNYCIIVDNEPATGPGDPNGYPTTPQEIADELRKKINADPDLIANTNDDAQVFVFIEGKVKVIDLGPTSSTNFPYAPRQPYQHELT